MSFNSKLVRLKVPQTVLIFNQKTAFQFQIGAIKSEHNVLLIECNVACFNSKLVRLKAAVHIAKTERGSFNSKLVRLKVR